MSIKYMITKTNTTTGRTTMASFQAYVNRATAIQHCSVYSNKAYTFSVVAVPSAIANRPTACNLFVRETPETQAEILAEYSA